MVLCNILVHYGNISRFAAAGDVYSWGYGVLGHGSGDHFSRTPKQVMGFENIGERVLHLYCGIEHAAVITGD